MWECLCCQSLHIVNVLYVCNIYCITRVYTVYIRLYTCMLGVCTRVGHVYNIIIIIIYVCTHTHTHMYIYICICIYIYKYTHHTQVTTTIYYCVSPSYHIHTKHYIHSVHTTMMLYMLYLYCIAIYLLWVTLTSAAGVRLHTSSTHRRSWECKNTQRIYSNDYYNEHIYTTDRCVPFIFTT